MSVDGEDIVGPLLWVEAEHPQTILMWDGSVKGMYIIEKMEAQEAGDVGIVNKTKF